MRILEERKYTAEELARTRTLRCRCGVGLSVKFGELEGELAVFENGTQKKSSWFVCIACQQKTYIADPYAPWKD